LINSGDRLEGGLRVFSLTISRDESVEPQKRDLASEMVKAMNPQDRDLQ
jgi:hypothetical protein